MIEACRSAKSALVIFIGVGSWVLPDCNARRVASQEKQPTDELACVGRLSLIDTREGAGSSVSAGGVSCKRRLPLIVPAATGRENCNRDGDCDDHFLHMLNLLALRGDGLRHFYALQCIRIGVGRSQRSEAK
jgi:hypothetical protein